jgi:predicted enzyme related to lactoylglutathione lyase
MARTWKLERACRGAALLGALTLAACSGEPAEGTQPSAATSGGPAPVTGPAGGATQAPSPGAAAAAGGGRVAPAGAAGVPAAISGGAGAQAAGSSASAPAGAAGGGGAAAGQPSAAGACKARALSGTDKALHVHHIHYNTQDPAAGIAFVEKYFNAKSIDFCSDESGAVLTRAAKVERAYFLFSKVAAPPSSMRMTRLGHTGYIQADVAGELKRLNDLGVPLADASVCATAAMGTPCNTATVQWFYVDMPESARFEIATGPGPATSGWGHIHLVAPTYSFFQNVLGAALKDPGGATPNVDGVNMINSGRTGVLDETITYGDTRGSAVDHIAFSTTDLEAELARIMGAGVKIEDPVSFKPEFGFRSFMVRSPEGVWVEIVEDAPFTP